MAAEISDRVREIAEGRDRPEFELFERALERVGRTKVEPGGDAIVTSSRRTSHGD